MRTEKNHTGHCAHDSGGTVTHPLSIIPFMGDTFAITIYHTPVPFVCVQALLSLQGTYGEQDSRSTEPRCLGNLCLADWSAQLPFAKRQAAIVASLLALL